MLVIYAGISLAIGFNLNTFQRVLKKKQERSSPLCFGLKSGDMLTQFPGNFNVCQIELLSMASEVKISESRKKILLCA